MERVLIFLKISCSFFLATIFKVPALTGFSIIVCTDRLHQVQGLRLLVAQDLRDDTRLLSLRRRR